MSGLVSGRGSTSVGSLAAIVPDPSRLRGVLDHLTQQGHSLALIAQSEPLLEAWGRALARGLRETPGVVVDLFMPASADALLSRFNQLLANLPLDRARAEPAPEQPLRIIFVSDLASFDSPEGALLARLVTDFPGANLRVLMLADCSSPEMAERVFGNFGRRLRRVALDQTAVLGMTIDPLPTLGVEPLRGEIRSPRTEPSAALGRIAHESNERAMAARRYKPDIPIESTQPGGRGRSGRAWFAWASVAIALLLISLLIVTLLHRDRTPYGTSPRAQVTEFWQRLALMPLAVDWRRSHV